MMTLALSLSGHSTEVTFGPAIGRLSDHSSIRVVKIIFGRGRRSRRRFRYRD